MLSILIAACVLLCPLMMIGMMVFMRGGMHPRRGKGEEKEQ